MPWTPHRARVLAIAGVIAGLGLIGAGLLCLSLAAGRGATGKVQGRATGPNVVLIVLDALRADRVEAERGGVPVMPHLAQFAQESAYYPNAVTQCTWTRPSMATLFTSLHVDTHQVYFSTDPNDPAQPKSDALPAALETMASYLRARGYGTAAVQTNVNLIEEFGFAAGFDRYVYKENAPANEVTAAALELLKAEPGPFFLYAHYIDPHLPYDPPEPYRRMFGWPPPLNPEELAVATDFLDYFWDTCDVLIGRKAARELPPLSAAGEEAVRTLYDGEARFVDEEAYRLLEHIRARFPNTIVIITADHGEHFWDHGYLGHGLTLYEEELRVPLALSGPGVEPGRDTAPVGLIDLLPTVAALLGLPAQPQWQGRSFRGAPPEPLRAYSFTRGPWTGCNTYREMVREGEMKLILDRRTDGVELYDMAADPLERHNLAAERPEEAQALRATLEAHRERCIQARRGGAAASVALPPEVRDQLRGLGYGPRD